MASESLTIEQPTLEDVDRMVDLFMADMHLLGRKPSRADMLKAARAMFDDPIMHLRVARVDGAVAGVLVANEFVSIKFPGRAIWIEELYVDPEYRRRGIGRVLCEAFVDWAHDNGFAGVELEAYRMNTAASVLYRSVGFQRLARERYTFDMADYVLEEDA